MAGGLQGQSFRRHVHLAQELPWQGAISGMRSDCDMAIWIKTREAAAAGITFYQSANAVLLTDTTIDPAFFHSVQILRSSEVLTAEGGPPNPQQITLAIFRAQARDTRSSEQYMAPPLPRTGHTAVPQHEPQSLLCASCRTCHDALAGGTCQGGDRGTTLVRDDGQCRDTRSTLPQHIVPRYMRRTMGSHISIYGEDRQRQQVMPILCWPPKRTSVPSTVSKPGDVCLPTTHFIHCILRSPPGRRSGSLLGGKQQTLHSARSVRPRATGKRHKRRQRSRKIKTSTTQGPKKRRRRNQPKGAGSQQRAYACLGLSVVALLWIRFGHRCDAWAEQLLHRLLVHGCSNLLLHSHKSRYRVQTKLPLPNGCDSENRPTVSEARPKGQYSRPGPKSGMGRMLLIMLLVIKCQLSHGVRVPTHSVGVGEGSPPVNTRSHCMPKINGIQVAYGKQDPTHEWNKYVKRSFKRACNRAVKHGQASYRGRMLTVKHAPEQQPSRPHRQHPSSKHPQRRLQVFCYNVGGLGSGPDLACMRT